MSEPYDGWRAALRERAVPASELVSAGWSDDLVVAEREGSRLVAVRDDESGRWLVPRWQFADSLKVREGVEEILGVWPAGLLALDNWMTRHIEAFGDVPARMLERGEWRRLRDRLATIGWS